MKNEIQSHLLTLMSFQTRIMFEERTEILLFTENGEQTKKPFIEIFVLLGTFKRVLESNKLYRNK